MRKITRASDSVFLGPFEQTKKPYRLSRMKKSDVGTNSLSGKNFKRDNPTREARKSSAFADDLYDVPRGIDPNSLQCNGCGKSGHREDEGYMVMDPSTNKPIHEMCAEEGTAGNFDSSSWSDEPPSNTVRVTNPDSYYEERWEPEDHTSLDSFRGRPREEKSPYSWLSRKSGVGSGYQPETPAEKYLEETYGVDLGGSDTETPDETNFLEDFTNRVMDGEPVLNEHIDELARKHNIPKVNERPQGPRNMPSDQELGKPWADALNDFKNNDPGYQTYQQMSPESPDVTGDSWPDSYPDEWGKQSGKSEDGKKCELQYDGVCTNNHVQYDPQYALKRCPECLNELDKGEDQ